MAQLTITNELLLNMGDENLVEADYEFIWSNVGLDYESELKPSQIEEIVACTLDCRYFIENFCWIERKETREILPFIPYDWQWDILERLQNGESLVINKSRRVGISWAIAAYTAWLTNFSEGAHVLFLSRTENDAKKLLRKVKFILRNLAYHDADHIRDATPASFLMGDVETDNQQFFSIKFRDDSGNTAGFSAAESLTMTVDAGRSEGPTLVFWDEAGFAKPNDEATWSALMPTTTRGSQMVVASTPNGVGGVFWGLVRDGQRGANSWYHYRFIHWSEAGMSQEQVDRVRDALKMTNEMYLQEFEGQFIQPGTRVFDATYLDACYRPFDRYPEVKDYLEQYDYNTGRYYLGVDSGTGSYHKKRIPDENVFLAVTRHGVVAYVEHNRKLLGDWAGKPITMADGTTGWQQGQVSKLHAEWPGIMYIEKKIGGDTVINNYQAPGDGQSLMIPVNPDNKSISRIMGNLILAVEGSQVIITDDTLYQQMYDIQRGTQPGTYSPPDGGSKDVLMAFAWAYDALLTYGGEAIPEQFRLPDPNRPSATGSFSLPILQYLPGMSTPLNVQHLRQTDMMEGPGRLPVPTINAPVPVTNLDGYRPRDRF